MLQLSCFDSNSGEKQWCLKLSWETEKNGKLKVMIGDLELTGLAGGWDEGDEGKEGTQVQGGGGGGGAGY